MMTSNPFRRHNSAFLSPHLRAQYKGQEGLELIFSAAAPHLLVRTNPNILCSCSSPASKTGLKTCTRCFGTGKVISSLDRFPCYISSSSPERMNNLGVQGLEAASTKLAYSLRNLYPQEGDLILEVGWNCANKDVYLKGNVKKIHNVYLIKHIDFIEMSEISYIENFVTMANTRKESLQHIFLYGNNLPVYRNKNI